MTPVMNNHLTMLMSQLSCIFQYVNEKKVHRSKWQDFATTSIDKDVVLSYQYVEISAGRSVVSIQVDTEHRKFNFQQHYNYGVMLNTEATTTLNFPGATQYQMAAFINKPEFDEGTIREAMIDFEYALSLVTLDVAKQVHYIGS